MNEWWRKRTKIADEQKRGGGVGSRGAMGLWEKRGATDHVTLAQRGDAATHSQNERWHNVEPPQHPPHTTPHVKILASFDLHSLGLVWGGPPEQK